MNDPQLQSEERTAALDTFLRAAALLAILLVPGLPIASFTGTGSLSFEIYAPVFLISTVMLAVYGTLALWRCCAAGSRLARLLLGVSLGVYGLQLVAGLLLPVVARDALIHHLAVPAFWREAGMPIEIAWHPWSYYPMALQTVFTGLLPMGEWACVLLHGLFLLLTAVLLGLLISHLLPEQRSLPAAGACLMLATPVCLSLADTPLVDLGLVFFCTCVVTCLLAGEYTRGRMVCCGIFLGTALSIKYNALLFAVACFAALPFFFRSHRVAFGGTVRHSLTISMISFIVYSPWLVRNALLTGNPIHPLFGRFFGSTDGGYSFAGVSPLLKRQYGYGESIGEIVLLPLRMLLFGKEGNPRLFDGVASPIFCLLIVAVLFLIVRSKDEPNSLRYRRVQIMGLTVLLVVYTAAALCMGPARIRYMAPVFAVVVLLTVFGLQQIHVWKPAVARLVIPVALFFHIGWGVYHSGVLSEAGVAYQIARGHLSADQYRAAHPEFELIQRINQSVPPDSCVLLVYTSNAFYWYTGCVQSGGYQSGATLVGAIKQASSPLDIYNDLRNRGVAYLFLHVDRTRKTFTINLSEQEKSRWTAFFEHAMKLEFSGRGYALWRIVSPEELPATSG